MLYSYIGVGTEYKSQIYSSQQSYLPDYWEGLSLLGVEGLQRAWAATGRVGKYKCGGIVGGGFDCGWLY